MVRYEQGRKAESRARIVAAAGRGFRRHGFGGIGVDGLAGEAGVTHGAFYGHFRSKTAAFRAAVAAGLDELRAGIESVRASHGAAWFEAFVGYYLGAKRLCEPGQACTLPTLSPDVERADVETRQVYEEELQRIVAVVAAGLPADTDDPEARAWALLSLLAGGAALARAVVDPALSERIAQSVAGAAVALERRP